MHVAYITTCMIFPLDHSQSVCNSLFACPHQATHLLVPTEQVTLLVTDKGITLLVANKQIIFMSPPSKPLCLLATIKCAPARKTSNSQHFPLSSFKSAFLLNRQNFIVAQSTPQILPLWLTTHNPNPMIIMMSYKPSLSYSPDNTHVFKFLPCSLSYSMAISLKTFKNLIKVFNQLHPTQKPTWNTAYIHL